MGLVIMVVADPASTLDRIDWKVVRPTVPALAVDPRALLRRRIARDSSSERESVSISILDGEEIARLTEEVIDEVGGGNAEERRR